MSTELTSPDDDLRVMQLNDVGAVEAYKRVGGETVLGALIPESFDVANGRFVQFTNGKIYSSALSGSWMVKGAILACYEACGGPTGRLGFPTSDERLIGNPEDVGGGWVGEFQNGMIQCLNTGKESPEIIITESSLAPGRNFSYRHSYADHGVVYQVFVGQEYNLSRLRRFGDIERFYDKCPAPLIVDCGANIGTSAVWFSQLFPKAETVAIEPDSGNFDLLKNNTAGLNVHAVRGAIAGKSGVLRLVDPGEGEWGYRTMGDGIPLGEVRAYSMAELVSVMPESVPFILKIDIEGAEGDLFRDDVDLYAQFPVIVIELHDWMLPGGGTSRPFLEWHIARDRDFVYHGENVFSMCNRKLLSAT